MEQTQYKEGQWLMFNHYAGQCLFRFNEIDNDGYTFPKEKYHIDHSGRASKQVDGRVKMDSGIFIPTPDQIQSILSKVAEWKGIKTGIKVISPFDNKIKYTIKGDYSIYKYHDDSLYVNQQLIYVPGVWATIVEAEEEKHGVCINPCEEYPNCPCLQKGHYIPSGIDSPKQEPVPFKYERAIDRVTTERLDLVLRMCDIQINKVLVGQGIDAVELIKEKGSETTIEDVEKMKESWKKTV